MLAYTASFWRKSVDGNAPEIAFSFFFLQTTCYVQTPILTAQCSMLHCILPFSFTYICLPVAPSHSLCLPSVIRQTDLLAQQHVRPPLHLTPLTNRLPTSESSLWPCHSLARLIGFHLSLQRKGSDYKQINRVGLHGGWPALAARIPCDRRGDWECVKVVGFENREFQGQVVYCGGAARMMEVAAGMMWLGVFFFFFFFLV